MTFRNFFIILFFFLLAAGCANKVKLTKIESRNYKLEKSNSDVDSAAYYKILPYQKSLAADMDKVIVYSEQSLEKGQPGGLLGNFVADACLEIANRAYYPEDGKKIDFLFLNNGGLRSSLPKGNITKGNIFELMPFENELVVLKINGSIVKKIFNFIASKDGAPVAGLKFTIKDKSAFNILINNMDFDSTRTYKAATSDYLANGGDQLFFLANVKERESLSLKVRDAIIEYLEQKSKQEEHLIVKQDYRINYVQ